MTLMPAPGVRPVRSISSHLAATAVLVDQYNCRTDWYADSRSAALVGPLAQVSNVSNHHHYHHRHHYHHKQLSPPPPPLSPPPHSTSEDPPPSLLPLAQVLAELRFAARNEARTLRHQLAAPLPPVPPSTVVTLPIALSAETRAMAMEAVRTRERTHALTLNLLTSRARTSRSSSASMSMRQGGSSGTVRRSSPLSKECSLRGKIPSDSLSTS
jgi:hypothetical protein